jgi:hypothetical protein
LRSLLLKNSSSGWHVDWSERFKEMR